MGYVPTAKISGCLDLAIQDLRDQKYFDRFLTSHFDIYFGVEVDAEKFRKNLHFPKSNR